MCIAWILWLHPSTQPGNKLIYFFSLSWMISICDVMFLYYCVLRKSQNKWYILPSNNSNWRQIVFYYINPSKMHMLQSLFYLTSALHVSGIIITHLQEHKSTVTAASGNRYSVLLSAAIVGEVEHSNQSQLFHDNSRQQYGVTVTRCCSYSWFVLLKMGDSDARNM